MGDQLVTRADLEGITADFTVALAILTKQMENLANQVNNVNNNGNQRRDRGRRMKLGFREVSTVIMLLLLKIKILKKKNATRKRFFDVMGAPENKQVKMVAIRMKSNVVVWWDKIIIHRQRSNICPTRRVSVVAEEKDEDKEREDLAVENDEYVEVKFIEEQYDERDCLDNFKDQNEFYYVSKDADDPDRSKGKNEDKWWLPTPKVPVDGLSDGARRFLQYQKDCVNQVLKAAMAINAQTLSEMEIPESYIESLPKNGRASLGDLIYRNITDEFFDPDQFLATEDMSSEHKILDLKNRIEASIGIWKRKMNQKDTKSAWGSAVSIEKRELFEERAETILLLLKHRFPGLPQSSLDISKIQFNRDVGQAILESYSRILESLAFTVLSRIEDVLHADCQTVSPSQGRKSSVRNPVPKPDKCPTLKEDAERSSSAEPLGSMTLSDFMG
ncbi:Rop guanine nucleotide exchange factor 11, variant 6 [Lathyrus oleraceus]|nr:Rop guanine nucleotide exchange factor 11, variant 6 [Pisum sativum]